MRMRQACPSAVQSGTLPHDDRTLGSGWLEPPRITRQEYHPSLQEETHRSRDPADGDLRCFGAGKTIRHGHRSTLHLWWARRPLAARGAALFAQLVDDPSSYPNKFPATVAVDEERKQPFGIV